MEHQAGEWEQTMEPGHFDVRGDREAIRRCFVGIVATVPRS